MNDTRDTLISRMKAPMVPADNEMGDDIVPYRRPNPRFKEDDILIMALYPDNPFTLRHKPYWDREFGGWLIAPGAIGVHECNYILASERDQWKPHLDGLWSWWERR